MNRSTFIEQLTGRPARKPSETPRSAVADLLTRQHMSEEEAAIALLVARAESLSQQMDRMSVAEQRALAEGLRRPAKRTKRVAEIDRHCTELDKLVRRAFEKRVKGVGESVHSARRSGRTVRLRESCSIASSGMCSCRRCIGGHC